MIRIAINGFGRIGKTFLRAIFSDDEINRKINVIAINTGNVPYKGIAHNFMYDTIMGPFLGSVQESEQTLTIKGHTIHLIQESEPSQLPWGDLGIDYVVESSGKFTHRDGAQRHIESGARAVLITAPATGEDIALIPGVNDDLFDRDSHKIISLGSCTTNAFIPLVKIVHDAFGIERGFMTTVHAYTNSQMLVDGMDSVDPRRGRAAAQNIIPTVTGARDMLGKIMPGMEKKIESYALRVPVANVSLVDFSCITEKEVASSTIHDAIIHAQKSRMKGIVAFIMEPLVSSDFIGNPASVIVDGLLTRAHHRTLKLFGWYDNEWGYCMRLCDFLTSNQ